MCVWHAERRVLHSSVPYSLCYTSPDVFHSIVLYNINYFSQITLSAVGPQHRLSTLQNKAID